LIRPKLTVLKWFTANPDIIEHTLGDEDEFMIIACDGKSSSQMAFVFSCHFFPQFSVCESGD